MKSISNTNQKGSVGIILLIILGILIVSGGVYLSKSAEAPVMVETEQEQVSVATTTVSTTSPQVIAAQKGNNEIKIAFRSLQAFSRGYPSMDTLCVGGFINSNSSDLRIISTQIVDNRIIDLDTLEYADTQDEAGITCLSGSGKWILFTALNEDPLNNGKNYYCADSKGQSGYMNIDRDNMVCVKS